MTAVPKRSTANRPVIKTNEIMITYLDRSGDKTSKPSTALSTEIAGVIMLSPKNRAAPSAPAIVTGQRKADVLLRLWETKAVSAKMPPSPWLSARMMMNTYLSVTTKTSDQLIKDRIPYTAATISAGLFAPEASTDTLSAYKGDVPMSPNTTPKAPTMRASIALDDMSLDWCDDINDPTL